jgi:5-hydroxyisourate hydrolase
MTGKLTTHVLDTANGCPAAGLAVTLYRGADRVAGGVTNSDGRLDAPLLAGGSFPPGEYRLEFAVGDYFTARGHGDAKKFLNVVPIVFTVQDAAQNYHVPLLVSPWSYSTYRGS